MMAIIHSLKCTALCRFHSLYHCSDSLSLIAIRCHPLSLLPLFATRCTTRHSLSLVVPLVVTRCHSLSILVPLVVTRCTIHFHSLSLVVPLVVTRCHSLSLVATRCTTILSFYKRSLASNNCTEDFTANVRMGIFQNA